jgi:hypothetical protein
MNRVWLIAAIVAALAGNLASSPNQSTDTHKADVVKQEPREPSPVTVVIQNDQSSEPAKHPAPETPSGDTAPEWVLVGVGIVTFIVIGWQSWETSKAAQAAKSSVGKMDEANRINKEALQAGERAYISYSLSDINIFRSEGSSGNMTHWHFRNAIENSGNTPAWSLLNTINAGWQQGELPRDFGFPDFGTATLTPNVSAKGKVYSQKLTLDQAIVREVYEKKLRLYFYGWSTYNDVFEGTPTHRTEFCHEVRILEIQPECLKLEIELHNQHNTQN